MVESNNNPIIMASIFLETVRKLKFCPQKLRTDLGTENCTMADCQCFLVESANAHFYGTSVANQRIENWWSFLKRSFTSWIIDFFKRLVAEGNLILGHRVHLKCVWYVFSTFIQSQLDEVVHEWNTHYIRKSRNDSIPGIPDVLFYAPNAAGFVDKKIVIGENKIEDLLNERDIITESNNAIEEITDHELNEYFDYVIELEGLSFPPKNWTEAKELFNHLISKCL